MTENKVSGRTDDLGRRIWDKNFFSQKALQRQYENGADPGMDFLKAHETGGKNKEIQIPPPVERRALEQRKQPIVLDEELGKMKVVTPLTPKQHQGGYWCDVCECLIKDSNAFLDHLNGRRHNKLLGMTMTVERVTADTVAKRLAQAKYLKYQQKQNIEEGSKENLYKRVAERLEETKKKPKKKKKAKIESDTVDNKILLENLFQTGHINDLPVNIQNEKESEKHIEARATRFDIPSTDIPAFNKTIQGSFKIKITFLMYHNVF
jgi:U4/U6.U5 tri-snRNP component SNU23